ncbi:ATP-binding cassette domain-containing protein, partial [Bacillus haikouensis]|uniref:ATP-binding cassette domain-containing protein n=1 Tax=Bacillus haikouensis TaxID=1510468 RepID=UPI0015565D1C
FYGPNVFRQVGQLSGGEKMRLRLAQLMHQDINFLVLDEPTNHLDIDSREVLEEALEDFKGTILAVSHDRYFLNKLFHKTYWIHNGKLFSFEGPYSWAKKKLVELAPQKEAKALVKKQAAPVQEKAVRVEPAVSIEEVEMELEELEAKIAVIDGELLAEADLDVLQELYREKEKLEKDRDEKYELLEKCL